MLCPTRAAYRLGSLQPRYLEELTVRIESLTNLGEGIAREGETGWVVMVPHVIPGEMVKCKVVRNHANYSEATLVGNVSVTTFFGGDWLQCNGLP